MSQVLEEEKRERKTKYVTITGIIKIRRKYQICVQTVDFLRVRYKFVGLFFLLYTRSKAKGIEVFLSLKK